MAKGSTYHPTDRPDEWAVAWNEIFVGFVKRKGDIRLPTWDAFDVDHQLVGEDFPTRTQAARKCWIANLTKPQVRLDRLIRMVREQAKES